MQCRQIAHLAKVSIPSRRVGDLASATTHATRTIVFPSPQGGSETTEIHVPIAIVDEFPSPQGGSETNSV